MINKEYNIRTGTFRVHIHTSGWTHAAIVNHDDFHVITGVRFCVMCDVISC